MRHALFFMVAIFCIMPASGATNAGPALKVSRAEVPSAVEAELSTREILCRLENLGDLVIPEGALASAELTGEGEREFIVTLCRLACSKNVPKVTAACDQSLIFISTAQGHEPVKMPGEVLDIRLRPGQPAKILSSSLSDHAACPVADGVCNPLYEIRGGELVQAGIE
ncbi:MAG: hypothetical protein ACREDW_06280 [Aestuariivirgaceae bacterium]